MLRNPEVAAAVVGGKTPEQVQQNIRYVNDLTAEDLAEIDAILDDAPEISWCATRDSKAAPIGRRSSHGRAVGLMG